MRHELENLKREVDRIKYDTTRFVDREDFRRSLDNAIQNLERRINSTNSELETLNRKVDELLNNLKEGNILPENYGS